jgi:hypothetical protein
MLQNRRGESETGFSAVEQKRCAHDDKDVETMKSYGMIDLGSGQPHAMKLPYSIVAKATARVSASLSHAAGTCVSCFGHSSL